MLKHGYCLLPKRHSSHQPTPISQRLIMTVQYLMDQLQTSLSFSYRHSSHPTCLNLTPNETYEAQFSYSSFFPPARSLTDGSEYFEIILTDTSIATTIDSDGYVFHKFWSSLSVSILGLNSLESSFESDLYYYLGRFEIIFCVLINFRLSSIFQEKCCSNRV